MELPEQIDRNGVEIGIGLQLLLVLFLFLWVLERIQL